MKRSGFTLIEVMISMAIFAGTLAAFAGVYVTTARLNESSRNLTQAMNDARVVLEAIRDIAQSGGSVAVVPTFFPAGNIILPAPATLPGIAAWSLPAGAGETISVSYADPATGLINLAADPLPVTVSVTWTEGGHPGRTTSVNTMVTRR